MLFGLVLVIHILVALFLITVILIQGGRGGMGETLSGAAAQSLFGGAANTVMTKITAVCAALFMVTCLSLAALSTAHGRSVMDRLRKGSGTLPLTLPQDQEPGPATETTTVPSHAPETPQLNPESAGGASLPQTPAASPSTSTEPSPALSPAQPSTSSGSHESP